MAVPQVASATHQVRLRGGPFRSTSKRPGITQQASENCSILGILQSLTPHHGQKPAVRQALATLASKAASLTMDKESAHM